jgi:hypothetical protein
MLPGETLLSGGVPPEPCEICGNKELPKLQVLRTCAFYVGTQCEECGCPISRETGYFKERKDAEAALARLEKADLSDARHVQQGDVRPIPTQQDPT